MKSLPKPRVRSLTAVALSMLCLLSVVAGCQENESRANGAMLPDSMKSEAMMEDSMKSGNMMKDGMMKDGMMKDGMMKDGMMKDGMMKDGAAPVDGDMKSGKKM